jgi:hypothetical protein
MILKGQEQMKETFREIRESFVDHKEYVGGVLNDRFEGFTDI